MEKLILSPTSRQCDFKAHGAGVENIGLYRFATRESLVGSTIILQLGSSRDVIRQNCRPMPHTTTPSTFPKPTLHRSIRAQSVQCSSWMSRQNQLASSAAMASLRRRAGPRRSSRERPFLVCQLSEPTQNTLRVGGQPVHSVSRELPRRTQHI